MSTMQDFFHVTGGGPAVPPSPQLQAQAGQMGAGPVASLPPDDDYDAEDVEEGDGLVVEDDGGFEETPLVPPPVISNRPSQVQPSTVTPPATDPGVNDLINAMQGGVNAVCSAIAPSAASAAAQPASPPSIPTNTPTAPAPAPAKDLTGNKEYDDYNKLGTEIFSLQRRLANQLGIVVIEDPKHCDSNNVIHVAIYNMRHNPMGLVNMTAKDLCIFEAALSAHQVWVQSMENEWAARHAYIGREMDRLMRIARTRYKADTEKDRENLVLANEPQMAKLRNDFLKAQAISTYLTEMGKRFSQLEDGLKRLISLRHDEEQRTHIQGRFTA